MFTTVHIGLSKYTILLLCNFYHCMGFLGGSVVKNLSANAGDSGLIPRLGRSPGEVFLPVFLAWKIPWTEELGGLSQWGRKRVRPDLTIKY